MESGDEIRRRFVEGWILRADDDLAVARLLLREGERFAFTAAFHSQQAAEKYLKAILIEDQVDFPKTHDITRLLELVARQRPDLSNSLNAATSLTIYAIEGRYPGDLPRLQLGEAARAFALAEEVMEAVRGALSR